MIPGGVLVQCPLPSLCLVWVQAVGVRVGSDPPNSSFWFSPSNCSHHPPWSRRGHRSHGTPAQSLEPEARRSVAPPSPTGARHSAYVCLIVHSNSHVRCLHHHFPDEKTKVQGRKATRSGSLGQQTKVALEARPPKPVPITSACLWGRDFCPHVTRF